ncbi:MAG: DUF1223 domain-containing protein, partial [Rubricoccaceae bacterium]|nr:DUF1223 domain-containing protein [Rubricoccaceae bacterium]
MPVALSVAMLLLLMSCSETPAPNTDYADTPRERQSNAAVAELFTSEGCSSCPPADALFAELAEREGVIALAFHVDYWNRLGWRDPYSQAAFSERQRAYARNLDGRVYTPELIVNGRVGLVGSRRHDVETAIADALKTASSISLKLEASAEDGVVIARFIVNGVPDGAVLQLALVERSTSQDVSRGENRGRTLTHTNVVRVFDTVPAVSGEQTLLLPDDLSPSNTRVV